MTRGFYPPPPRPGSNAVGLFQIGVSPVGTAGFVWQDTFISQYANSPSLVGVVAAFAEAEGLAQELDEFYDCVWNILTAQGHGLDVWGRILGVGRALEVDQGEYLGFAEALPGSNGWGQQAWYAGPPSSPNFLLADASYRSLLMAKAAFNICEGSIPAINRLLMSLFPGRGNAYVQEGLGLDETYLGFEEAGGPDIAGWDQAPWYSGQDFTQMSMRYIFGFPLTPVEQAIVAQSGVLPTPSGVTASVIINP